MSKPLGGLGRGLGALIPQAIQPKIETGIAAGEAIDLDTAHGLRILEISPDAIVENPHQPRLFFNEEDLHDLKMSIQEHGILQPLVVTKKGPGAYELIAGERRLRASRAIGLKVVPVIVRDEITEQKKLELALIENIQRAQLNAVEEAKGYQGLMDLFGLTQQEVGDRVGKSRSNVANTIRLLELDPAMLEALGDGRITRSHARTLLAEGDVGKRRVLFDRMLNGGVTVREAEAATYTAGRKMTDGKDATVLTLEKELREALGTKVMINMKNGSGKLQIAFYSKEELKKLIERLTK
jgi:ParB family chromosome partitioning protein